MWIFTTAGFYSIVDDTKTPGHLRVRARMRGDLERLGIVPRDIIEDNGADYRFRATVPREQVLAAIAREINAIDYPNYKDAVIDDRRVGFLLRVWNAMRDMQYAFLVKPQGQRSVRPPSSRKRRAGSGR